MHRELVLVVRIVLPDRFEELFPADNLARFRGEDVKQLELDEGQANVAVPEPDRVFPPVNREVAKCYSPCGHAPIVGVDCYSGWNEILLPGYEQINCVAGQRSTSRRLRYGVRRRCVDRETLGHGCANSHLKLSN